jgi:5-formyltetrahydrofolate cyclo-ligase
LTDDTAAWRQATRVELVARRMAIEPAQRQSWNNAIGQHLRTVLRPIVPGLLGIYWPFKGEFDPRPLAKELLTEGWSLALPVVVAKDGPLAFRAWTPDARIERGVLGIMIPSDGAWVAPGVVLAPLVGFDPARYRLGNGGGYFDRTLAALDPKPFAIGVGYALSRLATIHPQPHDRKMDIIVTEEGLLR